MYEPDQESWLFHVFGGGLNAINNDHFLLVVPYWMIAIPSTILSAYLILWPGKRKTAKPIQNSTTPTSDLQS